MSILGFCLGAIPTAIAWFAYIKLCDAEGRLRDIAYELAGSSEYIGVLRDEIARLSPLAEIGERRVQADRKYKAKKRKGNGDA